MSDFDDDIIADIELRKTERYGPYWHVTFKDGGKPMDFLAASPATMDVLIERAERRLIALRRVRSRRA